MLCHPTDRIQWWNFDQKHKDFATEVRNIIFGLIIDGINPFGETGNSYSTWPVMMSLYEAQVHDDAFVDQWPSLGL
jgi:hypothetical protein